jgi:outer membrane murein-binding lipoprotein Lpp
MSFFGRAKDFVGRMAGPSYGQRLSQVNQNNINNFTRTKLNAMDTKDTFKGLNKNTQLKVMTILKRLPQNLYTYNDLQDALTAARFSGSVNQSVARKAAAAAGYAAQRGALGAGVLAAAPVGLTAATIGGLGYTGYQGGRAAARGAQIFAGAAGKKYGNVRNIVSGTYSKLSGRNTNQRVANLNAKVKILEVQVRALTNAAQKANQMMAKAGRLNNYKKLPNTTGLYKI